MAFPITPQVITVQFLIGGVWTDVTNLRPTRNCYVLSPTGGSDDPGVITKRLKQSDTPLVKNGIEIRFFDPDAMLDNDNPFSPYYRRIPRGTNVQVFIDGNLWMYAALDAVEPDLVNPEAVVVTVTCIGAWDLNDSGHKPLESPIHRSTVPVPTLVDYWRLEEGTGSETFLSALEDGLPASLTGAVSFAADDTLGGSLPNPKMGSDTLAQFPVRAHSYNGHWQLDWMMHTPTLPTVDTTMMRVLTTGDPTIFYWDFILTGSGNQRIRGYDKNGNVVITNLFTTPVYMERGWVHYRLMVHDIGGGTIEWKFVEFPIPIQTGNFFTGTYSGSLGTPYMIQMISPIYQPDHSATLQGYSYGHIAMYDDYDFSATDQSGSGYTGERAGTRLIRLAGEEGVSLALVGNAADTMPMGPQRTDTVMELFLDCARADGGVLFDNRLSLNLGYRTRADIYTQSPTTELTYGLSHLSPPLKPVTGGVSDSTILNDVTADRPSGGSARYTIPNGDPDHWSTEAPPEGVYLRDGKITVNVANDSLLYGEAAWAAHLASWKEKRVAEVTVELERSALAGNPALSDALRSLGIMQLLAINTAGASAWLPPQQVRMLMESRHDSISQFGHKTTFNTRPADPYEVGGVNTSGSNLASTMTTSAVNFKVATTQGPSWSEVDEPYHVVLNGEAMRVTTVTTDTPAFIATGTVAHGNNGASVVPGLPAGMTPDVGQLLLLYAAISNSGVGTVDTPTGWTMITTNGNTAIFGRYYRTGDTAPTVTFTGGVLNTATSAVITGWSGLSLARGGSDSLTNGKGPASSHQTNGSAQNINYKTHYIFRDKCIALVFGWKQDDWTSVATLAGFTEAYDAFTTVGDDQGIVMDYALQGAPPITIPAGVFTVTGGAAAISRATVIALRPLQTFTVVRGVNNVNIVHGIGEAVRTWRMGINGL